MDKQIKKESIRTYKIQEIRERFIKKDQEINFFLKSSAEKFFIIREEDLAKLIRLPVPALRSTVHFLFYLSKGKSVMKVGGTRYTIESDECLAIPAGQVFSMENNSLDGLEGYLCSFSDDFIASNIIDYDLLKNFSFFTLWGNHHIKLTGQSSRYARFVLQRLMSEYEVNGNKNLSLLQSYFVALLTELNMAPGTRVENVLGPYQRTAKKFKELLFVHIKTKHFPSEYASMLNVTPNHLNKILKETTGKSTSAWIEDMLLMEAKVLLCHTNLSVNEIAGQIGLNDPAYFSRFFRKREKISPTAFRKTIE